MEGIDIPQILHQLNQLSSKVDGLIKKYDTGWINRSDWTNVHMGSSAVKDADSNVTHGLDAPLAELMIKVFISTDGTDAKSFEVYYYDDSATVGSHGFTYYAVDDDNFIVQTGAGGILYINNVGGGGGLLTTQNYYYKVVVYKFTV